MIKFFRHIRQTLIMENKTSKYFKYAIGEIILVVIGILIALQINNWNQTRQEKQQSLEICEGLKDETQRNISNLKIDINRLEGMLGADLEFLKMMGENYKDKEVRRLDSLVSYSISAPRLSLQQSVLNQSLNNNVWIKHISKDLKNRVYDFPRFIQDIKNREELIEQYVNEQFIPLISTQYSLRNMDAIFSPSMKEIGQSNFEIDSRKILGVLALENVLDNKYFLLNDVKRDYNSLLNSYESLLKALDDAIKNLK